MTLRHLSIFTAVADTLSMTAAAKKLFIAQPSVSQAIAELERDLGTKLFERLGGRLFLTDGGEQFLPYARHVSSLMSEATERFSGKTAKKKLRVASTITVGTTVFNDILVAFRNKNPDCALFFVSANTAIVEDLILSDKIDAALIEGTVSSPHIISHPVMDDELVVIAHPDNPLCRKRSCKSADLAGHEFIIREEGSGTRDVFEKMMRLREIPFAITGEMNNAEAIKHAVAAGLGLSVLSRLSVVNEVKRGELRILKISDLRFLRKFSIIYHKNKFITDHIRNFIETTVSLLPPFPDQNIPPVNK